MNKNTIIIAVIVIILAISLMYAELNGDKNLVNSSTNGSVDGKLNSTVRQMDNAYLQWVEITFKSMGSHVSDIANATRANNYSSLAIIGASLERDANMSLDQSRHLEVSPGLKPSLEEVQGSLEDYIIVGKYIETGGKNRDDKPLTDALYYARNATDHMTNVSIDVHKYMQTLK